MTGGERTCGGDAGLAVRRSGGVVYRCTRDRARRLLPLPMLKRFAPSLVVCLVLSACDGGDGDADPTPADSGPLAGSPGDASGPEDGDDAAAGVDSAAASGSDDAPLLTIDTDPGLGEVGVPIDIETSPSVGGDAAVAGTGLSVNTGLLCPSVGESVELSVTAAAPASTDGAERERRDVSADVRLSARYGDALEVLSQGDEAIALRMTRRDIVALDMVLEGESSVTVQMAGFDADAPPDVLMRKPVPGGCLYALRLREPAICGTALVRNGTGSLGTGDQVVTIDGCRFEAPDDLPVIELEPAGG